MSPELRTEALEVWTRVFGGRGGGGWGVEMASSLGVMGGA